ncbi:unnamed protein product [Diatraea saccharalis]|uniref:Fatty acid desaturase domain-containing protein n=1 Tax=Diatraea saccharalis TaxID=40085 RepID=A0A9N9QXQ2_9NEOP|nr:unnamed protein product [Diatraea saccharalis]
MGITAGAHRLWSHQAYKARWPLRLFLAILQTATFQDHIYEWVKHHRVHHKYTETDADPHNAKRGFFYSHMGWLLIQRHDDFFRKYDNVDMSDLEKDPIVMIQKKVYLIAMPVLCFILPAWIPVYFWNEDPWSSWYIAAIWRWVVSVHFTALVNSAAHLWGNKPYDKNENPTEDIFLDYQTRLRSRSLPKIHRIYLKSGIETKESRKIKTAVTSTEHGCVLLLLRRSQSSARPSSSVTYQGVKKLNCGEKEVKTPGKVYHDTVLEVVVKPLNNTLFKNEVWTFQQDSTEKKMKSLHPFGSYDATDSQTHTETRQTCNTPLFAYIGPTDHLTVALCTFGEGWHNYHHVFPWDYKAAELGNYSTNMVTGLIDLAAKLGLAYDLKTVSVDIIKKRAARTGDGSHPSTKHTNESVDDHVHPEKPTWGWGDRDMTEEEREYAVIHKNIT